MIKEVSYYLYGVKTYLPVHVYEQQLFILMQQAWHIALFKAINIRIKYIHVKQQLRE